MSQFDCSCSGALATLHASACASCFSEKPSLNVPVHGVGILILHLIPLIVAAAFVAVTFAQICQEHCQGYAYYGLQWGIECW